MNIDKLKSLIYVSELGSLTAASSAVHLTQAAVSQHIKDLENEFGFSFTPDCGFVIVTPYNV